MSWSSTPFGNAAARVGLGGSGAAGFVAALTIIHNPWAAVAAAGLAISPLIASAIARIAESRNSNRPELVRASGEAQAAQLRALAELVARYQAWTSETHAAAKRTEVHAELLRAGLEPDKADQAFRMLVLQYVNTDLPKDKRLDNESLTKLLSDLAKVLTEDNPTPRSPSGGPDARRAHQNVVPMRRNLTDLSEPAA